MLVLLEQKEIKLWSEQHSVENKADIMQHVLKMQWFFAAKIDKIINY